MRHYLFLVPVEKHGINAELRQKGKIATLACGYNGRRSAQGDGYPTDGAGRARTQTHRRRLPAHDDPTRLGSRAPTRRRRLRMRLLPQGLDAPKRQLAPVVGCAYARKRHDGIMRVSVEQLR